MSNLDCFEALPKVRTRKLNILPENPEAKDPESAVGPGRFPSWLHRKLPEGDALWNTGKILSENRLHTVCEEAKCPNLLECWSKKTATFLVMGKECTRSCGFCDIAFSKQPKPLDADEPERVAQSIAQLHLRHVVITMVARDDLPDGGASHLVAVMNKARALSPNITIEVLTTDFHGDYQALDIVLAAKPEIFNHNIETVRELSPRVRHTATYDRTLSTLAHARMSTYNPKLKVKSGIMVGLGETVDQVKSTIRDLSAAGCDIVTIGQYLQPNRNKLLVKSFVHPDQFKAYEEYGYEMGIKQMHCGPFVRSSYNADQFVEKVDSN